MFHVKHIDESIYKELYKLAEKSAKSGDVPVSSVVIYNDKIIGKGYNDRQKKNNVLGHAEANAIRSAEKYINDWRLNGCTLISTLKPCDMCAEIIRSSRIDEVYYIFDQEESSYDYIYKKLDVDNKYIRRYKKMFDDFFKNLR